MDDAAATAPEHAAGELPPFRSGARFAHRKLACSRSGWLALESGQLTLTTKHGVKLDVHVSELTHLHAPLYMLGCGLYFEAAAKKWYVTFNEVVDIDLGAVTRHGGQLGLSAAETQHLANQYLLCNVWLELLRQADAAVQA